MSALVRPLSALMSLCAVLLFTAAAHAQGTGRLSGTVRDASGSPVRSARVIATNALSGATRSTATDANGAYAIPGLAEGSYNVAVSMVGYRRATRTNVNVRGETTLDIVLEVLALQAVTVTATLREQELADVPFSIAAPTASVLRERGAENIEAIAANVAGFSVQNLGPGQSQVAMRGTSSGQIARDQPGVKEQVGAYLDDAPISLSLFTPDLDLFDVSRVEVLRGPQGTLFGAGSLSGTVRYITNQPELGVRSSFAELGLHGVQDGSGGGNVKVGSNIPLGDRAAARVAVYHNRMGGYMDAVQPNLSIDRNVNSGERSGGRAAVLITPSTSFSITPRVVAQRVRMDGWNRNDAFNILANPYTTSRPAVTLGERELFTQLEEPFTDDFVMGDLNLTWGLGAATLTSITSYTLRDILVVRDAGALTSSITGGSIGLSEDIYTLNAPLNDKTDSRVLTQEVRLAGQRGPVRWLTGGFYSTNDRDYGQQLLVSGFEAASGIPTEGLRAPKDVLFYSDLAYDLRQGAIFGEGTFSATPRLDLTAGLRYYNFSEDREQVFDGIFGNDNNGTSLVSQPGSTDANGLAPRFIASFRPTANLTFNALASRGFRLGGINDPLNVPLCTPEDLQTFSGRDTWKDETAWNYEAGMKSLWMGGRASLNVSAFYMDVRDLQLTLTAGSCSSRLIFNVPKAVSQGAEIELAVAPSQFLDLAASLSLNDATLRSTVTTTDAGGTTRVLAAIEDGNRLPSVPKVQASASATVRRPLRSAIVGGDGDGFLTASVQHVGSRFTQIEDLTPGIGTVNINSFAPNTIGGPLTQNTFTFDPILPAYTLANLRFGVRRAGGELSFFVNNLADERALLALDRERGLRARVGYLVNQPRTYGVMLRVEN